MTTLRILPAWSDQAGQCRIIARHGHVPSARDDYRENPGLWREVGLMASDGHVRCIEPQFRSICEDQPLAAGVQYHF